jgi:hypothetical protein
MNKTRLTIIPTLAASRVQVRLYDIDACAFGENHGGNSQIEREKIP